MVGLLGEVGLITSGESPAWKGGDATLVVTGDFMDRGTQVRKVMDLLMQLQEEAREAGGRVVVLMGNHEMMNLVGDYRYVTDGAIAEFAGPESEKIRDEDFRDHLKMIQKRARFLGTPAPSNLNEFEEDWMDEHPLGFVEYVEAMGPGGKYGRWLRDLPLVAEVGGILFVHGGIHPSLQNTPVSELNARAKKERRAFDSAKQQMISARLADRLSDLRDLTTAARQYAQRPPSPSTSGVSFQTGGGKLEAAVEALLTMGKWLSVSQNGPLWFRGYATWKEEDGTVWVRSILNSYRVNYIVVGHTVASEETVVRRFDGKVVLLDTIRPSIVLFQGGGLEVTYLDDPALRSSEGSDELMMPGVSRR